MLMGVETIAGVFYQLSSVVKYCMWLSSFSSMIDSLSFELQSLNDVPVRIGRIRHYIIM